MRTIILGDIHGCFREFTELLKKTDYRKGRDRLVLLGDLMDRGPYSWEMLHLAMDWREKYPESFFLIRGNHEQMLVEQSPALDTRLIWRVVGKTATMRSFRKHRDRPENYIPWILEHMPLYYVDEDFRCVHAGIAHEDFEANSMELLVKDHSWSKKNLYSGKITIIGHTPLASPTWYDGSGGPGIPLSYHQWERLPDKGAICIDTGCVFGDRLTAMIVEDGRYFLEYVDSGVHMENKAHTYVPWIKWLSGLPLVRRFCSGANAR